MTWMISVGTHCCKLNLSIFHNIFPQSFPILILPFLLPSRFTQFGRCLCLCGCCPNKQYCQINYRSNRLSWLCVCLRDKFNNVSRTFLTMARPNTSFNNSIGLCSYQVLYWNHSQQLKGNGIFKITCLCLKHSNNRTMKDPDFVSGFGLGKFKVSFVQWFSRLKIEFLVS